MPRELLIYVLPLIVTGVTASIISYLSWMRKPATGAHALSVLMMYVGTWPLL